MKDAPECDSSPNESEVITDCGADSANSKVDLTVLDSVKCRAESAPSVTILTNKAMMRRKDAKRSGNVSQSQWNN